MALTLLVLFNLFMSMSARSETLLIVQLNPLRNKFLLIASLVALLIHIAAMYIAPVASVLGMTPMSADQWLLCFLVSITVLFFCEGDKIIRAWLARHGHGPKSGLRAMGRRARRGIITMLKSSR